MSSNDSEFKTYKIDLSKNRGWRNTINDITLRFRTSLGSEGVEAGTVLIDHIEFLGEGEESNQDSTSKISKKLKESR